MSLLFAAASPSSLRRAARAPRRGEQSPVADLPHVQLQRVVRGRSRELARSRGSGSSFVVGTSSSAASAKRCSAAFLHTDALSVARLPRLRDDSMDEDLHECRSRCGSYQPSQPPRRLRSCAPFAPYRRLRPMCGIAGYSLGPDSAVRRTLAAQALLAGIAERGADAVRYAHRETGGRATVTKLRGGASALLDEIAVPTSASSVLIHVRDFTKRASRRRGEQPPDPPRVGRRCAQRRALERRRPACPLRDRASRPCHDRRLRGDLRPRRLRRTTPARCPRSGARWRLAGSTSASPTPVFLARGVSRPLWIGRTRTEVFASTRRALMIVEAALRLRLETEQLRQERLVEARAGRIARKERFRADQRYREAAAVSPVHSPHERLVPLAARCARVGQLSPAR